MAFVRMKHPYTDGTFLVHEARVEAHKADGFVLVEEEAPKEPADEKPAAPKRSTRKS